MEQKILILGFTSYNFEDNKGVQRKGCKIQYITENPVNEENKKGYLPITQNFDFEEFNKLKTTGLGLYNAKLSMLPGANGKAILGITSLDFIENIDFESLF